VLEKNGRSRNIAFGKLLDHNFRVFAIAEYHMRAIDSSELDRSPGMFFPREFCTKSGFCPKLSYKDVIRKSSGKRAHFGQFGQALANSKGVICPSSPINPTHVVIPNEKKAVFLYFIHRLLGWVGHLGNSVRRSPTFVGLPRPLAWSPNDN
jgi:hypothetical protein